MFTNTLNPRKCQASYLRYSWAVSNQIWIWRSQACWGPGFGWYDEREDATSDNACSTREAATLSACTDAAGGWGGESWVSGGFVKGFWVLVSTCMAGERSLRFKDTTSERASPMEEGTTCSPGVGAVGKGQPLTDNAEDGIIWTRDDWLKMMFTLPLNYYL